MSTITDETKNDIDIKICVIGAGVNGLCVTRHLIKNSLSNVTIFEATSRIGGIWNYEPDPKYPNPLYMNMTTNIHRQLMHFPDLDFETECKEVHPHHSFILEYIKYFAKQFDLIKYIKFKHKIQNITPPNMGKLHHKNDNLKSRFPQWIVTYHDIMRNEIKHEFFDTVIVCNGHFIKQYIPSFEGLETTQIPYFHSRCYREPKNELFDNKIIVIVGAGASGRDIGNEIFAKCNNIKIYQVVHSIYNHGSKKDFVLKCFIKQFTEKTIEFDDGIIIYPDLVIFCTGYLHNHSFLNSDEFTQHCLIKTRNGFHCNGQAINGLYQHMIYCHLPSIFFPGINHGVAPFLYAYYQCIWIAKILTDLAYTEKDNETVWSSKYLPDKKEMVKWMKRKKQFSGLRLQHRMPQQTAYFKCICAQIGQTYPIKGDL